MSLIKQLWLAIGFLMSLAFLGSFYVSCLSAQTYLEEQLYRKNIDNASNLALTLSSDTRDEMLIELFINAQWDTGHYQSIRLLNANGDAIIEHNDESSFSEAPEWLIQLFPINSEPGIAQVSQGWHQLGTLSVSSHARFAYQQLWANAQRLFYYFLIMLIGSGFIGSYILQRITNPLHKAVDHAEAIGERRFIQTTEPNTLEFKAVIRAMNKLSRHVKSMLDDESAKLEKLRKDAQFDRTTHLLNREPTLNQLSSLLQKEDERARGSIVLVRISDLFHLNQQKGRDTMDSMLRYFGDALHVQLEQRLDDLGFSGRLNGSDFLVVLPGEDEGAEQNGRDILKALQRVCLELDLEDIDLLVSCTPYSSKDNVSDLLSRLDEVLESSALKETATSVFIQAGELSDNEDKPHVNWEETLSEALSDKRFTLESFKVLSSNEQLLHWESPAVLIEKDGSQIPAGIFMPHVARLGYGALLDLIIVQLAFDRLKENPVPIGVNLSASLLQMPHKMTELQQLIQYYPELAHLLWLEVPEYGAFQNMEGFRILCQLLNPLQCKLGIEHIGQEIPNIGQLHDLGLDYVKIDRALVYNIHDNASNQVFLRGLCTIVHSIGLQAIAEGVSSEQEWLSLKELGIDGGTGTFF